jgi:hypothetical protein
MLTVVLLLLQQLRVVWTGSELRMVKNIAINSTSVCQNQFAKLAPFTAILIPTSYC